MDSQAPKLHESLPLEGEESLIYNGFILEAKARHYLRPRRGAAMSPNIGPDELQGFSLDFSQLPHGGARCNFFAWGGLIFVRGCGRIAGRPGGPKDTSQKRMAVKQYCLPKREPVQGHEVVAPAPAKARTRTLPPAKARWGSVPKPSRARAVPGSKRRASAVPVNLAKARAAPRAKARTDGRSMKE